MTEAEQVSADYIRECLEENAKHGLNQNPPIPEPPTEVVRQVLDEYETVAYGRFGNKLHPVDPETGDPLCADHQGFDADRLSRAPSDSFHAEHVTIGKKCLVLWRRAKGDDRWSL